MFRDAITTSRLSLKPYYAGMVTDNHVQWLNDPEVVRYSEQRHKVHTIESVHEYVNEINSSPDSFMWGIYQRLVNISAGSATMKHIGTITAHLDRPNGVANVGILLSKSVWGLGLGAEAWGAVCNWLFEEQNVRKIEMGCHYENRAMRSLAERCGMTLEGVRHDHFVVDGKPQHLMLYATMRPSQVKVTINEGATLKSVW